MALLDSVQSKLTATLGGDQNKSLLNVVLAQTGGLQGLASRFNTSGMAEVFNGWVAVGENGGIKPEQIEAVLDNQAIQQIAQKLGIDTTRATATLSQLLPQVVDKLTPNGNREEAVAAVDAETAAEAGPTG